MYQIIQKITLLIALPIFSFVLFASCSGVKIQSFDQAKTIENTLYREGAVLPLDSCPVKIVEARAVNSKILGYSCQLTIYNASGKRLRAVRFLGRFWNDFDEPIVPEGYLIHDAERLDVAPARTLKIKWTLPRDVSDFAVAVTRVIYEDGTDWRPTTLESKRLEAFQNAKAGYWQ